MEGKKIIFFISFVVVFSWITVSLGGNVLYIFLLIIIFAIYWTGYWEKKNRVIKRVEDAAVYSNLWDIKRMSDRALEVFAAFKKDWADGNIEATKNYATDFFYNRKSLEMAVLNSRAKKKIINSQVLFTSIYDAAAGSNSDGQDKFTINLWGWFNGVLEDLNDKKNVSSSFYFLERWSFVRIDDEWMLDSIDVISQVKFVQDLKLKSFAEQNGFYFGQEFAWLINQKKGVILSNATIPKSLVINHVIGSFNDKIVEFYNVPPGCHDIFIDADISYSGYLVAQSVLPKSYHDIFVKRKSALTFKNFSWLRKIETESNDFNRKFDLWADSRDQVNSFELLAPDFMEKIYNLPFDLSIEVVDNFLFLYLRNDKSVDYQQVLEILSCAFREMEK